VVQGQKTKNKAGITTLMVAKGGRNGTGTATEDHSTGLRNLLERTNLLFSSPSRLLV